MMHLSKEDIEKLGWKLHCEEGNNRSYKAVFSKEWSQCPPEAKCFDHDYGSYILSYEKRKNFEQYLISLEIVKQGTGGGWAGPYEKVLFESDGSHATYTTKELEFLMKILNIE